MKDQCTKAKYGKGVQRSEYQEYINRNKERIEQNQNHYRRRQEIVEHPYGTIKRQWGFSYIITKKGKQRASADVGLMFVAYNIRRIMNILGKDELKKYLKELVLMFSAQIRHISLQISLLKTSGFIDEIISNIFYHPLKRHIFEKYLLKTEGF